MKKRRSKKLCMMRRAAPQPADPQCAKRKEALNCTGRQKRKLIYHAAHRRGC